MLFGAETGAIASETQLARAIALSGMRISREERQIRKGRAIALPRSQRLEAKPLLNVCLFAHQLVPPQVFEGMVAAKGASHQL
jgi:hypothetical protein